MDENKSTDPNTLKDNHHHTPKTSTETETSDNDCWGQDMASLFTNTEYVTKSISIPYYTTATTAAAATATSNLNDERTSQSNLEIKLICSPSASTDYDLTGQILWPVSVLLSHFIASKRGQELVANKNVIELGAGCGLPGLVAAHFAKKVILTDGNETVMDLLKQNCDAFVIPPSRTMMTSSSSSIIESYQFRWGNTSQLSHLLQTWGPCDTVIAADVVQWPAVIEPLLHTVKALLWCSNNNSINMNPNSNDPNQNPQQQQQQQEPKQNRKFILGIVERAQSTNQLFFKTAMKLGFQCTQISIKDFLNDGILPYTRQVYGELYELVLVDTTDPPILLQPLKHQGEDKEVELDLTLGESYQNTLFLPC